MSAAQPVQAGSSSIEDNDRVPSEHRALDGEATLKLIQWHIDRYDRLRSSTSSRASVLLSANAALFAGTVLLLNARVIGRPLVWGVMVSGLLTACVIATSIYLCMNAIASWRTVRQFHDKEIPSRLLFNWGDTVRSVDGFSSFARAVRSQTLGEVVDNGLAELWTDILQHKRRHKYLRHGMHTFRAAILLFALFVVVAVFFSI